MTAADSRSWVLSRSETQRKLIASLVYESEAGWVVKLEPPRRSLAQNNLLHALLTEAVQAGLATDDGRRLTVDEAKTAFVTAWMEETGQTTDMVMFGGRPVQLRRSTTELTKAELSELVEFIYAECAARGIQLRELAA
jgi:NinB protein